ncbi:MAG TPA: T9SS type A sorting domain-containing protein [Flavobacterium sp.]|uniref:T9SS type A sorting domain-containing protein n=1 Tax=Flavobacterium sp. TaxID=239 RepID=UPI002BEFF44C|nr:T9SS type A sorting domain-containing protein [Flavobacterium sp.]HSD13077.1 T9SS type A sorting domain-containing protein [Flavobacterium sp.]
MKKVLLILITAPQFLIAQTTLIPDPKFEEKLIALGYDAPPVNGSVPTANIDDITDLDLSLSQITNLTGIEAFTSLTYLNCSSNSLTNLNVSSLTLLQELECDGNALTALNVTANTSLHYLEAYSNQLTAINLSQNPDLTYIGLDDNNLTTLDISLNTDIIELHCGGNPLGTLNLGQNVNLKILDVYQTNLSSINVSMLTGLEFLGLTGNNLTSIDLSQNAALQELRISDNLLTSLSIATCPLLTKIKCQFNQLTTLDLRNGNNMNFVLLPDYGAANNPGLSCISVDDPAYSATNWGTAFHPTATYSANCLLNTNSNLMQAFTIYPNPSNGKVFINTPDLININQITVFDLNGRIIRQVKPTGISEQTELDLTGIGQGVYLASIESEEGKLNAKIILK